MDKQKREIEDIFVPSENKKKFKSLKKLIVQVDYREKNSLVASNLISLGMGVEFKELKVGDYVIKETIIERKTVEDFWQSMLNRRLVNQLEELQQFRKRILIIEGIEEQELYSEERDNKEGKGIHPNSIRGFLLSIILKYQTPIIFSKNPEDTAKYIFLLGKKQQKDMSFHGKKKTLNPLEQKRYILESFPGIGPKTSKKLLEKFTSISDVMNSPKEELEGIVGKKAEILFNIIHSRE